MDLGFCGPKFTWERGSNPGSIIRERLDRYLCMASWRDLYGMATVRVLARFSSDRSPILLSTEYLPISRNMVQRCNRFEVLWLAHEECNKIVVDSWESNHGQRVNNRLENIVVELKSWHEKKFKEIPTKIKIMDAKLSKAQEGPISQESIEEVKRLQQSIEEMQRDLESYWFIRARDADIKHGGMNTSYFHKKASDRRRRNTITTLKKDDDSWTNNEEEVVDAVLQFYSELFWDREALGYGGGTEWGRAKNKRPNEPCSRQTLL